MFVFGSSAISLLTIAALGFFSEFLTKYWAAFIFFASGRIIGIASIENSFHAFTIILGGAAIFGIPALIGAVIIQLIAYDELV